MLQKLKQFSFGDLWLLAGLLLVGGFHEHVACALAVAMSVYLAVRLSRSKVLVVPRSLTALAVGAVCLGYGLSCFWAVDPGMALIGFVKFLPVGLYALCIWQEEGEHRVLSVLPSFAALLTLVSALGMQIPAFRGLFSVADRLAGFFQYPNSFALFLLVCELLVLKKKKLTLWDYGTLAVLIGGLLYTGSRTVFVLFLVSNFAAFFCGREKKTRYLLLALAAAALAVVGIILLTAGEDSVLRRYLTISLTESTFVGRILYMLDALPLLFKHPFGMGYMGYYYSQTGIQTGLYAVAYVHNDFLQLLLDVGLIPGGLFIAAVVSFFLRRGVGVMDKLPAAVVCLHSLFDFDLQFMALFCLLLLLMDQGGKKTLRIQKGLPALRVTAALMAVLSLYLGTALALSHFGQLETADKLYPFNTQNKLAMLEQEDDLERANEIAGEILRQNTTCYVPYSVQAKYAYSKGDFVSLIQNKNTVFTLNRFGYEEYEEYCVMLINGILLYEQMGDTESAEICKGQLLATQALLRANGELCGTLGRMIKDQPITELSGDVCYYIENMG